MGKNLERSGNTATAHSLRPLELEIPEAAASKHPEMAASSESRLGRVVAV